MATSSAQLRELLLDPDPDRWQLEFTSAFHAVAYCSIVGVALLVYDISLTLGREVNLFWFTQWTFCKVLYFVNRYLPLSSLSFLLFVLFHPFSDTFCTVAIHYQIWLGTLQIWALQSILAIRIHALWNKSRIFWSVIVCFGITAAAMVVVTQRSVGPIDAEVEPRPGGVRHCLGDPNQAYSKLSFIWTWWIPPSIFELYLVILSSMALIRNIRFIRRDALLCLNFRSLAELIARDPLWYFVLVFLINLANLVLWQSPHVIEAPQWTNGLTAPVLSIIGTRLLLDIREFGGQNTFVTGLVQQSFGTTATFQEMEFAIASDNGKTRKPPQDSDETQMPACAACEFEPPDNNEEV